MRVFTSLAFLLAVGVAISHAQFNNVVGYATLNGGCTGGAGGPTVTVSNSADLIREAAGDSAKIIKIRGTITLSGIVRVGSNKSILGADSSAGVTARGGFRIESKRNVIIRGLRIYKIVDPDKGIDVIGSTNIWIDHNDFYSDLDHGKDYYDGLVDIKRQSDYVTVSWNRFHHHYKVSLVGNSDSETADRGKLRVTYHNNWFYNVGSRLPSLRFGTGHVYNNVFEDAESSGINSRMGAQCYIQNNVFKNVKTSIATNLDSIEQGYVNENNNLFTNSPTAITRTGSFTNPPYTYSLQSVHTIEATVKAGAGQTISFP